MDPFITSMNLESNKTYTEKGALAHGRTNLLDMTQSFKTTEHSDILSQKKLTADMVGFWNTLLLGSSKEDVEYYLDSLYLSSCDSVDTHTHFSNILTLYVIWAETRDCRGNLAGKGWRDGSHWIFFSLLERFPNTTLELLELRAQH